MTKARLTKQQVDVLDFITLDGMTQAAAAATAGIAPQTVSEWAGGKGNVGKLWRAEYDQRMERALDAGTDELLCAVRACVRMIVDLALGRSVLHASSVSVTRLRFDAAKTILNRVGLAELKEQISDEEARARIAAVMD